MTESKGVMRRRHTINERIAIIEEYELTEMGVRSGVLRRHEFSASTMSTWRRQKREGLLEPSEHKESRRLTRKERAEFLALQKENTALKARLAQVESTVEVLGKTSALLGALAKSATPDQAPEPEPPVTRRSAVVRSSW
ncbi:transposase [Georgenia yuyongxinii]|uniref:Transposase n=1 Tax=Georgenia yuyongxinii TaxID=2589797 RepID=A0A552WXT9_9MICO|nr:transposase [Georgenia yuyongxinii]TRW47143.1 transposase [Georgenia yuyongxinii]